MDYLNTAPKPEKFIARPKEFGQLRQRLLSPQRAPSVALTTALQGGGGFGKTTLAQHLCHDDEVKANFPDGILWLTLGQSPELIELLNNLIYHFEPTKQFTNINAAANHLRDLLTQRRVLLVLDDVWQEDHARLFLQQSPGCALLITTRRQDIVLRLGSQPIDVNEMTTDQAVELLSGGLKGLTEKDMSLLRELAILLGEWPLLLNLASAPLNELVTLDNYPLDKAVSELKFALKEHGFSAFDRAQEQERNQAISHSLNVSLSFLERLVPQEKLPERYLALAVFGEDVDIPFAALEKLWRGLTSYEVRRAVRTMQRLSLFNRYEPQAETVHLHAVIRGYLVEQQQNLSGLHAHFLDAYRDDLTPPPDTELKPDWADLPPDELYLWDHLAYHLVEAGLRDELRTTVTNLRYLAAKSQARTANAVEADLQAAQEQFPEDWLLDTLRRHFINVAHLLNRCDNLNSLQATLYSRLAYVEALRELSRPFAPALKPPYLALTQRPPDLPHPALVRTLAGHTAFVSGCAFSPDGRRILSASFDHTLKVWDAQSGLALLTLTGHSDYVSGCAFSPDGKRIVSASVDKTLKVWDAQSGQALLTLQGHTAYVLGCAFSPDGRRILSASSDQTLKVWDAQNGQTQLTLQGHTGTVSGCAFSPDGRRILSASGDKTLKVWDAQSGQALLTLQGHMAAAFGCAFSPDGKRIVSTSADQTLKVWDAQTGQSLLTLQGHTDYVYGCTFSPDGKRIVSASWDKTLKVWDTQSGQAQLTLQGHTVSVRGCDISPDTLEGTSGEYIVSASGDKTLKVWDAQSGQALLTLQGHKDYVYGCAFSPDGGRILSASFDRTLKVWDVQSGQALLTLQGHTDYVYGCAFSPDGGRILSASADQTLKVWDAQTGQSLLTLQGHTDYVLGCAYSPDGKRILSASVDQTLKVWDAQTGQTLLTLQGHTADAWGCAFSSDGRRILSASFDRTLKVWDAQSGQSQLTLQGHTAPVWGCAYSPNGKRILSASDDNTLKVWDAQTGQCLATLAVEGALHDCAWSPDGEHLVGVGAAGVYFLRFVGE